MKFRFLDRFSPEVKMVSQVYREKAKQNNKVVKQQVLLVEAMDFLLRSTELLEGNQTLSSTRKDTVPF